MLKPRINFYEGTLGGLKEAFCVATNTYKKNSTKNTNSKKNSSSRSNNSAGKNNKNRVGSKEIESFHDEIILIVTLVISLLLILSGFHLSGKVGEAINYVTFGLIGSFAYILPYLLFIGVAFHVANHGNMVALRKLISSIGLSVVVIAFLQMLTDDSTSKSLVEYFQVSASSKNGGGFIGATICKLLYPLFGAIGTYIIYAALMAILLMLITEKLLFASLGRKGKKTVATMKEKRSVYINQREAAYEEMGTNEEERPKRKAKTFTFKKADKLTNAGMNSKAVKADSNLATEINSSITNPSSSNQLEREERVSPSFMNIPIQRENSSAHEDNLEDTLHPVDDNKPVFEKEIASKFGKNKDYDIKALANQIIGNHEIEELQISKEQNPEPKTKKQVEKSEPPMDINLTEPETKEYQFPPINLLTKPKVSVKGGSDFELKETAMKLQSTLESFGVKVSITNVSCGPAVTRYELQPEQGVKVSKITGLADDIKLNLAAADIRIEAPIPGKAAVGIEVPNKTNTAVMLRELIESQEFVKHPSDIAFAVGKDIGGQTVVTDIAKMPHLLIAGATGSGKSVCINTIIMGILYKAKPADVKLIMVDPKVVELSVYNGIPHLLVPVVTDPKKASAALNWAVMEMTERYNKFAEIGVRDIKGYNEKIKAVKEYNDEKHQKMPQIVIIVDELADLMMVAPGEVEDAICRLAQMARAAGLHLIIATQRPSVNVITGLIKANIPSRIAFSVSSAIDSRTILDGSGAEKLLGKGDMLFFPSGYPKPVRIQGAFVSDKEVSDVVKFLSSTNSETQYSEDINHQITVATESASSANHAANDRDEYFVEAGKFIIDKDKASIGMLQRVYKIGFNRAARIMDQLYEAGVVSQEEGTKPRKVMMSLEEFEQYVEEYV